MSTCVDNDKRRILRIIQVREQSKDIAKKLRCRVNFEKNKQISLVASEKEKQFKNLKREFVDDLKSNHKKYLSNVGNSHLNVQNENQELEEWKNQKKYQILKAQQRGDKASLKERETLGKNKKLTVHIKNRTKPALRLTVVKNKKDNSNSCECDQIPNNKDTLTSAELHTYPASEENKICDNNTADILEKPKMPLNLDKILNDNVEEFLNSSQLFENSTSKPKETLRHSSKIESVQPIEFVSHYIKSREIEPCIEKEDKKDDVNSRQLESIRETIEHSKQFATEYNDSYKNPILKLKQNDVIDSETADIQNTSYIKNPYLISSDGNNKKKASKFMYFKKDPFISKKNFTTVKKKNQHASSIFKPKDKYNMNYSFKKKWEPPKWQIGEKNKDPSQQFLKSYDYFNKFKKNIVIDNSQFIERLRMRSPNAFQNAKNEIERMREIINSTKDASEVRKKDAIARMKVESDYKKLLKELEKLSKQEANEAKMNINQIEIPLEMDFEYLNPSNYQNLKTSNNPRKFREAVLNVATWSAFSESELRDTNLPIKDSDDSSKSAIFITNSHVNKNNDSSVEENNNIKKQKSVPEKSIKQNTATYKNDIDDSNEKCNTNSNKVINEIHKSSNFKTVPSIDEDNQMKKIKKKMKHKNKTKPYKNIEHIAESDHNVLASSKESFSFEGIQIVIEVKKNENKSTQIVTMKDEKVQTIKDSSSSSHEISMQTSKVVYKENIACTKMGSHSIYKSDTSSESTVYMNLPDKISKYSKILHIDEEKAKIGSNTDNKTNRNTCDKNVKKQLQNTNSPPTKLYENTSNKLNHVIGNKQIDRDILGRKLKNKEVTNDTINKNSVQFDIRQSDSVLKDSGSHKIISNSNQNSTDRRNNLIVNENQNLSNHKKSEMIDSKGNLTDSKLKEYIETLLTLSNIRMEKININVSDITTPNSSVINDPSNISPAYLPHHIVNKLDRLKVFVQNNYDLLDVLDDKSMVNKLKHFVGKNKKKPDHIIHKLDKLKVFVQNNYNLLDELNDDHSIKNKWKHLITKNKKKLIQNDNKITENVPNVIITSKEKNQQLDSTQRKQVISEKKIIDDAYKINTNSLSSSDVAYNFNSLTKLEKELFDGSETETNDKKSNSTTKRDSQTLIEECNQRISVLSDMLIQLRKEKHSIPSPSKSLTSLENETINTSPSKHKDSSANSPDYVPLLTNIPKPDTFSTYDHKKNGQHLIDISHFTTSNTKIDLKNEYIHSKPPVALNKHYKLTQNENYSELIPHELSTIVEVDTPKTIRNSSILSKTHDAVPLIKPFDEHSAFTNFPQGKTGTTKHVDRNQFEQYGDNQSQNSRSIIIAPNLEESNDINTNYQPFISFNDYLKTRKAGDQHENEISESSNLNKYNTSPNMEMAQNIEFSQLHSREHSGSETSGNFSAELNTVLKDAGINWGISTMKKTKNSFLASDSSQSSHKQMFTKGNASVNSSTCSSALSEDLQICYEAFKKLSIEDLSKLSLNKELKMLMKNLENGNIHANTSNEAGGSTMSTNNRQVESNNFNANHSKLLVENTSSSKDKTQQRTSTPIQIEKSSQSSSTISSKYNSNGLFSIDSDLSSVKNISTSDKNTSNDNGTLTIPNISLELNKCANIKK